MKRVLLFSLKLLFRDWRSGEITVLALALVVAVAATTATSLFADRLNRTMVLQAAEFLAADLVVTSHYALPDDWLDVARQFDVNSARTAEFSSVILNEDDLLLSGIKAVSSGYPLPPPSNRLPSHCAFLNPENSSCLPLTFAHFCLLYCCLYRLFTMPAPYWLWVTV